MTEPGSIVDTRPPRQLAHFQVTKQHRRFVEFADAVRRHRYIGACFGAPGLGKTLSARTYAAADDWDHWAINRYSKDTRLPPSLDASRTAMATPYVGITARQLFYEVQRCVGWLSTDIERLHRPDYDPELEWYSENPCRTELLIIDEADRLKTNGLEQLRDFFDRHDLGVILIGMPGFDRHLARYPQLYSRIGFAHQYKPLDTEDIPVILAHYWQQLGLPDTDVDPDSEVVGTIIRITGGNFRLIERLMTQVGRLMDINSFDDISPDLITAARQTLVIGTQ
jgi:DNA transposition AAA+ family ATPase